LDGNNFFFSGVYYIRTLQDRVLCCTMACYVALWMQCSCITVLHNAENALVYHHRTITEQM